MDNPIVIGLLIVAGVIYKIYESFKEEQSKAKLRMEKLKKQAQKTINIPELPNKPTHRKDFDFANTNTLSKAERINKENADATEKYERRKAMAIKQRKELKMQIKPELEILDDQISFDLRQAIIQQAILNRPYSQY